jgi:hypothetical protein
MSKSGKITIGFLFSFMLIAVVLGGIVASNAKAAKDGEWELWTSAKIIDVDPLYSIGGFGMMAHFDNMAWAVIWRQDIVGKWPAIGQTGSLYKKGSEDKTKWKWVRKKLSKKIKAKVKRKTKHDPNNVISLPPQIILPENTEWERASTTPEIDKIVVVRFDDGRTSTAYINNDKEWKLDIERNKYRGGKTINNVKEWKDIGI